MKNFSALPSTFAKVASVRHISTMNKAQSVILFDSHSTESDVYPLVTQAFPELHRKFNFKKFLFEISPCNNGLTIEKEIAKQTNDTYQSLCEKSNFPFEMLKFSNEKLGTKYDPDNFLKKDFVECGARLSNKDVLEIVRKSFDKIIPDDEKRQAFAYSIWAVLNNHRISSLAQIVTKTIGEDGCVRADYADVAGNNSPKNMMFRNFTMVEAIVSGLEASRGVIGLFGLGHYDNNSFGIKNIIARTYKAQQTPEAELSEEERSLKRLTRIDPEQIIFINIFKGEPIDEFGKSYRIEKKEGESDKFPLYTIDATKIKADEFVEQVDDIAKRHRGNFSPAVSRQKLVR